jgi:predicted metal-dependent peptidase
MSDVYQQAERLVGRARTALLLDHPFFGLLLLRRQIEMTERIPTAAADAEGRIYINPIWVITLPLEQVIFLLAHETMHVALLHLLRMGNRIRDAWNVACDKVINDILVTERVGKPIPGGTYLGGARLKSAEELYNPEDTMESGGVGPDMAGRQPTEAEAKQLATEIQQEIKQVAQAIKAGRSKVPASIDRLIKDMTEVDTPWFDILERFMVNVAHNDYSWRQPSRRFVGADLYLPSIRSVGTMGPMAFVTDTSGSIGYEDLKVAAGHVNRIIEQAVPEILYAMYCDTRVQSVDEVLPDDLPFLPKQIGGGGTDFRPPFKWLDKRDIKPDVLVYFTDADGDFPDNEPDYPVIWLVTTDRPVPWGERIQYKKGEQVWR